MAITIITSPSFFTSPNFHFNSTHTVRFGRSRIPVAFAATERTANINSSSLYEVLGVSAGADTVAVKAAYRRLARVLHPDAGSCESSADEFMKVHSAYMTLVDPEKRAAYDQSLVPRRTGMSSPVRFSDGYRSRRWETDQCW